MSRIVLAANAEADQPWVADAAAELAAQMGAEVAVLSVDELESVMLSTMPRQDVVKRAERAADAALERVRAAGIQATRTVRSGPALERILEFADEQDAEVIVVGSSVRGRVASAMLGSVPIGLVRRSRRPVLVISGPNP